MDGLLQKGAKEELSQVWEVGSGSTKPVIQDPPPGRGEGDKQRMDSSFCPHVLFNCFMGTGKCVEELSSSLKYGVRVGNPFTEE